MPSDWRALIYEFGPAAHDLYDQRTPQYPGQKPVTLAEARRRLGASTAC